MSNRVQSRKGIKVFPWPSLRLFHIPVPKPYLWFLFHQRFDHPLYQKFKWTAQELVANGLELPVMEVFYTIQGEGKFSGHPAYFIRLGGCDVGCVWCDVKESWEADRWPVFPIEEIADRAASFPARLVVVTGGEPLMYNLDPLTNLLKHKGFTIHIETSGTHPFSGDFDWVCFSPKKFKKAHESIYKVADELKVVVFHKTDFSFAEDHASRVNEACELRLQPEWGKASRLMGEIIDYAKNNPNWKISLQTHKFMDIP